MPGLNLLDQPKRIKNADMLLSICVLYRHYFLDRSVPMSNALDNFCATGSTQGEFRLVIELPTACIDKKSLRRRVAVTLHGGQVKLVGSKADDTEVSFSACTAAGSLQKPTLANIWHITAQARHTDSLEGLSARLHLEWAIYYARWIFVVIPFLILIWGGWGYFKFSLVMLLTVVCFNLAVHAALTLAPIQTIRWDGLIRLVELIITSIYTTWVHLTLGSYNFNIMYGILLPVGALTGGFVRSIQLGVIILVLMTASNYLVALAHPENFTALSHIMNTLANAVILGFLTFVVLFVLGWERETARFAHTDLLTGLWNRRAFLPAFRQLVALAKRQDTPLSVLVCDLDHFKETNDTFGHAVGDQVLRELWCCIRRVLRLQDYAARMGGEEFTIALPGTSLKGAMEVASRLQHALQEQPGPRGMEITTSIGVAELAGANDTPEQLLERGDQALYQAKAEGRNRVVAWMHATDTTA